ncbi:MAG: alkaline phosphatase family protein [Bacteroidales bacterium]|jgi:hypothetical protein|nr:alkaline phosphatase family protein [Bacteroidales bacterium]
MRTFAKISVVVFLIILISFSCKDEPLEPRYLTENVIVIVIDGPRYSETWGDSSHQNIPRLSNQLSKLGVINTQFYNDGPTYTLAGHTSITTGNYQEIDNSGNELPMNPSFFQYWNEQYFDSIENSWIVASKDKLEVLSNCLNVEYNDNYKPSTNCGIDGLSSGYRNDSITFNVLIGVLEDHHPNLVLVNFREPDYSGHSGNWNNYINGIKSTDEYAYKIWDYIQNDSHYKGKTSLFITNDHGRHLDSVSNGFISHGDDCLGCRHVNFFAYGPDFKKDVIIDKRRELIDISATISEILMIDKESGNGEIMQELFK